MTYNKKIFKKKKKMFGRSNQDMPKKVPRPISYTGRKQNTYDEISYDDISPFKTPETQLIVDPVPKLIVDRIPTPVRTKQTTKKSRWGWKLPLLLGIGAILGYSRFHNRANRERMNNGIIPPSPKGL